MDVPTNLLGPLQEIFACGIIGYAFATTIYGITVLQTYMYYRRYPHDRRSLKAFVGILWILDTLTTVLMSHALYAFFVLNLGHLEDDVNLPWSFTDLITAMVQCYFAERLWRLSQGNKFLSGAIVILALITLALGIEGTVKVFSNHDLLSDTFQRSLVLGGAVQAAAVLGDVLITGGLCYYFVANKTGTRRINALLDKLMAYAIERGILTATVQTLYLIMSVAYPKKFYFVPFAMLVAKTYVNTLLASLNVRRPLDNGTWREEEPSPIQFSSQTWSPDVAQSSAKPDTSTPSDSATQVALQTIWVGTTADQV
ncbi:hypothetical protein L226DRAFT_595056 [Lentinus tigrinus ALCF2SS1-7]|uniref:DUF6534 domain-containing protein n=1 Tax=Lentinus tigrinus ALCF2SS1-6 TaxID=1328759 RepID=A0A5C2RZQ1_9APHY|nr:hypothetical protein L227DRAFT_614452 [Lentinus tigrinus ALCF2SS1-6]RPD79523.1 hypothetical protein L226DRAFT_595056 [Lentinus tigrinus ALCF2SS1-7]